MICFSSASNRLYFTLLCIGIAFNPNRTLSTLARPRVGLGSLPANRHPSPVKNPPVTVDLLQALHVRLYFTAQVTFDQNPIAVYNMNDLAKLLIAKFACADIRIDFRLLENLPGSRWANAINVRKRCLNTLFIWDFYS